MSTPEIARSAPNTNTASPLVADTPTDEAAFTALAEQYRRELQLHCYRMLGSLEDAEDLVQETYLRAWRSRERFEGRAPFRAWLYRIATNACLDSLERRPDRKVPRREPGSVESFEVLWLQPYPDSLLEGVAAREDEPDAAVVSRETIELAYLVAIQHLPPRTRAVLILRDVLGWSAGDTASLLDASVAAANSALQRARATLKKHLPERRLEWAPDTDPNEAERALIQRYMDATERGDAQALAATLHEDVRFAMPPEPGVWVGRDVVVTSWVEGGFGSEAFGQWRCVPTRANRQPAVAGYVRHPGESVYRRLAMDVLRIEGGEVADVTTFNAAVFPAFGLPETLS